MRLHQIVLLAALATIPLVAFTADAEGPAKKALYTPHPPATLTPGKYILRMRLTSVNGQPFRSTMIRAVPVVIAMKGNTVGFGGKWGPQITGTYGNGVLSASGPTPGGSTFQVTGTGGGGTGQFQMTQDGVKVGGEYLLDPLTTAMPGDTMAPPGSTTGMNGLTPISFGWDINGAPVSSGPASGGTGYSNGYNSSLSRGIGAPGVANDGPNLGGTSVSGWFSDDPSPKTPISKPKPGGGGGGGGGSSAGTAKDPKPYVAPGDKPAPAGDSGGFRRGGTRGASYVEAAAAPAPAAARPARAAPRARPARATRATTARTTPVRAAAT
jgi:hypothetical protein